MGGYVRCGSPCKLHVVGGWAAVRRRRMVGYNWLQFGSQALESPLSQYLQRLAGCVSRRYSVSQLRHQ